jgi:hypothetical protein
VHLTSGAHTITVRYARHGGPLEFDVLWGSEGNVPSSIPAWALRARADRGRTGALVSAVAGICLVPVEWTWVGLLTLLALLAGVQAAVRLRRAIVPYLDWRWLRWILAASLVLNGVGLWWGLPALWVQIELAPTWVLAAWAARFSHGWYDAYPPLHFYVLAIVTSPFLLLQAMGHLTMENQGVYVLALALYRGVSLLAAGVAVVATGLAASLAFGRRAGIVAAAILALNGTFVFYAKTANVDAPYLCWFALSLVFYVRMSAGGRRSDYVWFAACGMLSIGTKDQAYGLYLLPPVLILHQIWREHRRAGEPAPWRRTVTDRRLLAAAGTAVGVFLVSQNLPINLSGFLAHVRFITGGGSRGYRVFDPTLAGHVELLRLTLALIRDSMGWPLAVASVAGLVVAAVTPRHRRLLVWLAAPVLSYYFGFINVVLYNYDRFVLPICLILAVFGGLAVDRLLASTRGRAWRVALVAGVFAYSALYAATVDVLMLEDSRYSVERWVLEHTDPKDFVGMSGPPEFRPRLNPSRVDDVGTIADLEDAKPRYYVLDADYVRGIPKDDPWGGLVYGLEHGTVGYRLVATFRTPSPWPWLPGGDPDLVGPRLDPLVSSTLRGINPTLEVFRCETACDDR